MINVLPKQWGLFVPSFFELHFIICSKYMALHDTISLLVGKERKAGRPDMKASVPE
jgi:hypothetical protein